ncbi:hypothetical protein SFRURICE_006255 [Spodoptera frugiperda]|nr:hypothetical protein SFRURICE_006255 [Spodoptera frugiperda]
MCRSVKNSGNRADSRQNYLSEDDSDEIFKIVMMGGKDNKPYYINVSIDNFEIKCEIDTGSRISAIDEETYTRQFSHKIIKPDNLILYEELVGSGSGDACEPAIVIDLTGDDAITVPTACPMLNGHNKIKKYIKLNKTIKKLKKRQNLSKLNLTLRKKTKKQSKTIYDLDIQALRQELLQREMFLNQMFEKYESAQSEINKHMIEAVLRDMNHWQITFLVVVPTPCLLSRNIIHLFHIWLPGQVLIKNACVFTDSIGAGIGSLISNCLNYNYSMTNYCYNDIKFSQMIQKIKQQCITQNQPIVLLMGDSTGVKRRDVLDGIETLLNLDIGMRVICAFPYSDTLSETQNKNIHYLNNLMFTLTCCHKDKLLKCKVLLARLLANNINLVLDNLSDKSILYRQSNNIEISSIYDSTKETHHLMANVGGTPDNILN